MISAGAQELSAPEGSLATRRRPALIAHVIPTLRVAGLENVVARLRAKRPADEPSLGSEEAEGAET